MIRTLYFVDQHRMAKPLSLLESYSWLGQFSYPNRTEDGFPGTLRYSPDKGLQLEYMLPFSVQPPSTDILFGVLQNGTTCTLYGDFNPIRGGGFHLGRTASIRNGIKGLRFGVFGGHFETDHSFDSFDLNFNNFQEFCFPEHRRDEAPFSEEPLVEADCGSIHVQIVNRGIFRFASAKLLANELHSDDEELLSDLRKAIEGSVSRYPKSEFFKRSKIDWSIRLLDNSGASAKTWMERLRDFELLFSLLLFRPVRPIEMQLSATNLQDQPRTFSVLGGLAGITNRTLIHLEREQLRHFLPIHLDSIDFPAVVKRWLKTKDRFELFATKVMNDFGDRSNLGTRSELIILLAQLESVANEAGFSSQKTRYEDAFRTFGKQTLHERLKSAFGAWDLSVVGKSLSDLRAEIAHFGRPPVWLKKLSLMQLIALNRYIDITIASFIYKELGINDAVIEKFQTQQLHLVRVQPPPTSAPPQVPVNTPL